MAEDVAAPGRLRNLIIKAAPKLKKESKVEQLPRMLEIVNIIQQQQQAKSRFLANEPSDLVKPRRLYQPLRRQAQFRIDGKDEDSFLRKLSPFNFQQTQKQKLTGYCETTFSAVVGRDLQKRSHGKTIAVVHLFLGREEATDEHGRHFHEMSSPLDILLRTMLRQLVEAKLQKGLPSIVLKKLRDSATNTIDSSLIAVRSYLLDEMADLERVFFVIDALDQCPESFQTSVREELARLLPKDRVSVLLVQGSSTPVPAKIIKCGRIPECGNDVVLYWHCVVCRNGNYDLCQICFDQGYYCDDRTHKLDEPYKAIEVPLRTTESELVVHIKRKLQDEIQSSSFLGKRLGAAQEVIDKIENTIAAKAAGVFVLAKIYIDYLSSKQSLDDILEVLDHLPETEAGYFNTLLLDVKQQHDRDDRYLGLLTLDIVRKASYEARNITFSELTGALEQFNKSHGKDPLDVTPERILRVTGGLLMIQPDKDLEVRPFHDNVNIFLYENREEDFADLGLDMAHLCLSSLVDSSDFIHSMTGSAHQNAEKTFATRPFLRYALQCWGPHMLHTKSPEAQNAALRFLQEHWTRSSILQQIAVIVGDGFGFREPWSLSTGVHLCAWFGLRNVLASLRKQEPNLDINAKDKITGRTPLTIACIRNNAETVRDLLNAGADIAITCKRGAAALWEAVNRGHDKIVEMLVEKADTETLNKTYAHSSQQTAFMIAISMTKRDVWKSFLSRSDDLSVTVQDTDGKTALHIAIESGNAEAIGWLAKRQDFSHFANLQDNLLKRTALMYIVEPVEPLKAIVNGGSHSLRLECFTTLIHLGANLDIRDGLGRNLLHYAAADADALEILKYLLQIGTGVDQVDHLGSTALHTACANGNIAAIPMLLQAGANAVARDAKGRTPTQVAELCDVSDAVQALGDVDTPIAGADSYESPERAVWQLVFDDPDQLTTGTATFSKSAIQATDPLGLTALHCAVIMNQPSILRKMLEDSRFQVNAVDLKGETALHRFVYQFGEDGFTESLEMADMLLQKNIDVGILDYHGYSALDTAIDKKIWTLAARVFKHNPSIALSRGRMKPLFWRSCAREEPQLINCLIDAGVDMLERDGMGRLPSQIASDNNRDLEVVDMLRQAENDACAGRTRGIS
ncbi:MAG: hypothetical protein M1820_003661 [Bogoriella megaspora]|nr:MAG: hypothetical protein M1820_003661 [Bogoriella megaspora]